MSYRHVQRGWVHYLLLLVGATALAGGLISATSGQEVAPFLLLGGAAFLVLPMLFANLLIEDRGDHLFVQFGPIGAFSKRVPYSSILAVERGRTSLVDGIGIHWIPGRGWIWNIASGECVVLTLQKGTLRLGSDDAENLHRFLEQRIVVQAH